MKRFPFPVPYGWFFVGYANDLSNGDIKQLHYFGQDLALWRDEEGEAHLQELYCPHLGANLAVGGKVKGKLIECPFHWWRFNGEGNVAEIDYATRLNENACLKTYPLQEYYGVLMAWYHPNGEQPKWQLPPIPEADGDEWVGPLSFGHTVKTCLQEMSENTADAAHFTTIHNHPGEANYEVFDFDGPSMIMRSTQEFPSSKGSVKGTLGTDTLGFGWSVTRYGTLIDMVMLGTNVAIDEDSCEQHFHVWYKNPDRDEKVDRIGKAFYNEVDRQFQDDIPIWENKIYRDKPNLCDGDGPIARLRKWASQFYVV